MHIYPKNTDALEFNKIKQYLHEHCSGPLAQAKVEAMYPSSDDEEVNVWLKQTFEYKVMLEVGDYLPVAFSLNVTRELSLLGITGSVLTPEQFLRLKTLAESIDNIFRFFKIKGENYPTLHAIARQTHYEKAIVDDIDKIIDNDKSVRSTASNDLYEIRLSLSKKRQERDRQFQKAIQRMIKLGWLADTEQSIRNGRRVLSVLSEHKRSLKGIMHGISDTGKTSFIEPDETIELNNEVFELETEEQQEIYRILKRLTQTVAPHQSLLKQYQDISAEYDFIQSRAKLGMALSASYPSVSKKRDVHLVKAIHPLLYLHNRHNKKETTPLDITLDGQNRVLIISGPNAGGKTIALKTVGLLHVMAQCGLLVPCHESSHLCVFHDVMVHIGDAQSVEYELSTYSAHLTHMKHFCRLADKHTLFLVDELGSGSDPVLGGAFAEAIMEHLAKSGAMGVVTTHYLNLKILAQKTNGIVNGAMEFDEENLLPLYRLVMGKPGSSYTFAIAERIGMQRSLIERAKILVEKDAYRFDELLKQLEQDKKIIDQQQADLAKEHSEFEVMKRQYQSLLTGQQDHINKAVNAAMGKELQSLKDTEQKLKQLIGEWKNSKDKNKLSQKIAAILVKNAPVKTKQVVYKKNATYIPINAPIEIGALVKVRTDNRLGKVVSMRNNRVVLDVSGLNIEFYKEDVVRVEKREEKEEPSNTH